MRMHVPSVHTKIFGIIGHPLHHTLSPLLHTSLYREYGFDAIYIPYEVVKPTRQELLTLNKYGLFGLSVTIPYKEWAFSIADHADRSARLMKAGNTLVLREDGIHLYNTDGLGAVRSIENFHKSLLSPRSKGNILLLGSGGSARGIGFSILEFWKKKQIPLTKKVLVSARNIEKGKALVQEMNSYYSDSTIFVPLSEIDDACTKSARLVIHATQVGMSGQDAGPLLGAKLLHKNMVIFDIVYNPMETELVKLAKKFRIPTIPGIDMLLYQGIEQFRIFTGMYPTKNSILKVRKFLFSELRKRSRLQ